MATGLLSVVITPESRNAIEQQVAIKHLTPFLHHVTLSFGREITNEEKRLIGRCVPIAVTSVVWDDRAQACEVLLPEDVPCQSVHPYITISTAEGVPPVESSKLFSSWRAERLRFDPPIVLEGVIQFKKVKCRKSKA